jgi:heme/copper-type cytochrome/quinol oxidase subunit 2
MKTKASIDVFSLRMLFALVIVLIEIVFINSLASAGMELILSSVVVTIALLIQLRFGVRPAAAAPADIVVFIFNWLFLDLAPKVQLMSMPQRLINTSTVTVDGVALTNLVCALFMIAFTFFYAFLSRREENPQPARPVRVKPRQEFTAGAIGLVLVLCVAVVAVAAPHAYRSVENAEVASPASLVINRFLLFLPSATLLILLHETVRSGRKLLFSRVCVLLMLFLLVVVTENPYTEKRNALGPIYIALLLVLFQNWFATGTRRLLLLVGSMVLVFPAITVFTHNRQQSLADVSFSQFSDQIADHYFSINYDSWANIYTAVEIVKVHGMQWGHQLLGSLLFFVPSSIWSAKPLATGIFLADYLIANYSMWFTNLSAPLAAEGYLDFGPAGVVLYACILAAFVVLLNGLALRRDRWVAFPMAIYASVFLMIVLRGSLMIALGFACAAFLAFCFVAALLSVKIGVRHRISTRMGSRPTMVG